MQINILSDKIKTEARFDIQSDIDLPLQARDNKVGQQYQWFSNSFAGFEVLWRVFYPFISFQPLTLTTDAWFFCSPPFSQPASPS